MAVISRIGGKMARLTLSRSGWADSVPQEKLRQWEQEQDEWLWKNPEPHTRGTEGRISRAIHGAVSALARRGHGGLLCCATRKFRQWSRKRCGIFDGDRYVLGHYVVMPNHVHAVVRPLQGHLLKEILHSWKSFTAHEINEVLNREGAGVAG